MTVLVSNPTIVPGMVGDDYRLYMEATRQWLRGGDFYPAWQLAGPYYSSDWPILYPPHALTLLVPFAYLPPVLWFLVPPILTGWIIIWHRPRPWTWPILLSLVAFFPLAWVPYISGTPTVWIVAFTAAATRWRWPAALVLLKPSLAPFALLGVRDPRWWAVVASIIVLSILGWSLTMTWLRALGNFQGAGPFYSLENLPLLLAPIVGWAGSSRRGPAVGRRRPAVSPGLGPPQGSGSAVIDTVSGDHV